MKRKLQFLVTCLFLIMGTKVFSQSNFSLSAYIQFLESHQNMSADQLLNLYSAGKFAPEEDIDISNIRYLDSISIKYGLTDFEKSILSKNGFVVSERMSKESCGQAFLDIFREDLPVFVSTDAILHAFHKSYDKILMDVELDIIINKVKLLLQTLHSNQNLLLTKYGSIPGMQKSLKDVDVYLTVPLNLFELNVSSFYVDNSSFVDSILSYIENLEPSTIKLFSDNDRIIDWSQFKPRGHYVDDPSFGITTDLPKYFKVMMWLGRTELYLMAPENTSGFNPSFEDLQRQIIDSYLIKELIENTNSYSIYEDIENGIKIFAGDQDNVTLDNLSYLKNAINFNETDDLLDSLKVVEFQDTLKNQSFAY
jgi:hypothetical protein